MVKGWLSLLAFAGGLYFGREVKARDIVVPPNVIFVPPRIELQPDREPLRLDEIVRHVTREAMRLELSEDEIKRLSKELERRIKEIDPNLERLMKMYRRQYYLDKLERIAAAFCEGSIDRVTYILLTRRYIDKIVALEM
jgi:hypothetical protein